MATGIGRFDTFSDAKQVSHKYHPWGLSPPLARRHRSVPVARHCWAGQCLGIITDPTDVQMNWSTTWTIKNGKRMASWHCQRSFRSCVLVCGPARTIPANTVARGPSSETWQAWRMLCAHWNLSKHVSATHMGMGETKFGTVKMPVDNHQCQWNIFTGTHVSAKLVMLNVRVSNFYDILIYT